MLGEVREQCGIFGVFGHPEAARLTWFGLHALQHRGQESAGIAACDGRQTLAHKAKGLAGDVFDEDLLAGLPGTGAIGHVRYATAGHGDLAAAQPFVARWSGGTLAVAHNGNLVNAPALRAELEAGGALFQSSSDSEALVHLVARAHGHALVDRVVESLGHVRGAYSLVYLTERALLGVRDPHGLRPLVMGRIGPAHVLASETCALDLVEAEFVREIDPGEVVVIDAEGVRSSRPLAPAPLARCIFELVYFARPDSVAFGQSVYQLRKELGRRTAREQPVPADVVVPVPDSGTPAAMGFAEQSRLPLDAALIRSHYVGRTFIGPRHAARPWEVRRKLAPVASALAGRRVVLVDDSLVRGTTSREIVRMVREAGAREVHLRIASPPVAWPCSFGIDTPDRTELAAALGDLPALARELGADSLGYLSPEGLSAAAGSAGGWCDACFSGRYPVDPGR